ncbi:MAG: hypothetical protein WBG71_11800 [Leeuwenhoekiella sp.]
MIPSFFKRKKEAFSSREFVSSLIATSTYFLFAFFYFRWVLNVTEFYYAISIPVYAGLVYINYLVLCRATDKLAHTVKQQTHKKIEQILAKEKLPEILTEDFTFSVQEQMARMAEVSEKPLSKNTDSDNVATAKKYDGIQQEFFTRLRQAELNKSIYESGLNRRFSSEGKDMDKVVEKE